MNESGIISSKMQWCRRLISRVLDLIYPRYCLICGENLQDTTRFCLCTNCQNKVERINPEESCPRCGHPLGPFAQRQGVCPDCSHRSMVFARAIAAGRYEGVLKELILKFKYRREKVLADPLAQFLIERLRSEKEMLTEIDLVMPVPLHRKKLRERGFNQAELIAERISETFSLPLSARNLIRRKNILPQVSLSRNQRLSNPKDAFGIKDEGEVKDKRVLIVDDVLTTGATATEIARLLKRAGAKRVYVAVIGR